MGFEGIGASFVNRAREIAQAGLNRVQQTVQNITGGTENRQSSSDAIQHVTAQFVSGQNRTDPPPSTAPPIHDDGGSSLTGGNLAGRDPQTVITPIAQTSQVTITREVTPSKVTGANAPPPSEHIVIDAGAGDDNVQVTRDAQTGFVTVNVNGENHVFRGNDANILTIRAGDGNDTVNITPDIRLNFVIEGGAGDDRITSGAGQDRIEAGAGNDTVDGGEGRDYINGNAGNDTISGGAGDDVVYGGEGDDVLSGNTGNDYLEGSRGNDRLAGNAGSDILSGGIGDDTLEGGADDDTLYAGQGRDRLFGTAAADTNAANSTDADMFYAQEEDEVVKNQRSTRITVALTGTPGSRAIRIEGTPEFVERVEADMEMLRSSPTGRQMLDTFDRRYDDTRSSLAGVPLLGRMVNDGHTVTIRELPDEDNGFAQSSGNNNFLDRATGRPGSGSDSTISYNTQLQSSRFPAPVVVLYHEMSHAYNAVTGTFQPDTYTGPGVDGPTVDANGNVIRPGVNNRERQAVGLDNTGVAYDFDNDPNTPATTANPRPLTENGLRDELRLPPRPAYRG